MNRSTAVAVASDATPPELGGLSVLEFLTWAAGDKAARAYAAQGEGLVYAEIGQRIGASETRVMKLLRHARDQLQDAPALVPFHPLPLRVVSAVRLGGYRHPRELLKPWRTGTLHRIEGIGVGGALTLSEWLKHRAAELDRC